MQVQFIYKRQTEIALAFVKSIFFDKMCENRCNLKIMQSMIRVNNRDIIRRTKK